MSTIGIGVDPETVHSVANQCRSIQQNLDAQVSNFTQQLSALEGSLQGAAAQTFMTQFTKWKELVREMSDTLGTTGKTLDQIASTAEQQIAALRQLGQG